jgi:hypothetical protein
MIDSSIVMSLENLDQFQFSPSLLGALTSAGADFGDITGAITQGVSSEPSLDALLSGAAAVNTPAALFLYTTHFITSSARASVMYVKSTRTTWYANAIGTRIDVPDQSVPANVPMLSSSSSIGAQFGVSYALSPNTQLRGEFSSTRTMYASDRLYTNSGTLALARTIGRNWFFSVEGGAGVMTSPSTTSVPLSGPQYLATGIAGFTSGNHTFTTSYSRTLAQGYIYGALAAQSAQGAWHWAPPGRSWSLSAGFTRQTYDAGPFAGDHGWQILGDVSRNVTSRVSWHLGYAYLHYSRAPVASPFPTFSQAMIRTSLQWANTSR